MKRKVLFVITKSNWGGAQRYVFDLATNLPKEEFDVAVALGGSGMLKEKLEAAGIQTISITSLQRDISFGADIKSYFELRRLFKKEQPDVVHLNSSKAGGVGAFAARRAGIQKIIFTSHGLAYDENRNPLARGGIWLATWFTFLLCHEVIVISTDNERRAKRLPFCKNKIRLIHNGTLAPVYLEREAARAALSPKMVPLPQSTMWIGSIAELTWNKGLHYLVRAAGDLKRRGIDFILCIIGEGSERIFLETLINDEGLKDRVYLIGFVEQAAQYLRAFDVFTLPSTKEGLPYVLIEAGLAGLPIVATNVGGVSDIATDKVSGFLVKPKNHKELADKLEILIKDSVLRARYGDAARDQAVKEFSLSRMVEETKKVYIS